MVDWITLGSAFAGGFLGYAVPRMWLWRWPPLFEVVEQPPRPCARDPLAQGPGRRDWYFLGKWHFAISVRPRWQ